MKTYVNLSLAKIMASIARNGNCDCVTFMSAIEWNLCQNDNSVTRLAKDLKCENQPFIVYLALHKHLFDGLNYVPGHYNSYNYLSDLDMAWEHTQQLVNILRNS